MAQIPLSVREKEKKMTEEHSDGRVKFLHGQPKNLTVDQKFRLILRLLRERFPTDLPVRVRRVTKEIMGADTPYGICSLVNASKPKSKRYYLILINKQHPWSQQCETILHEWAHALTWYQLEDGKDHGDIFARKYGVLYREFIED